MAKRDERERNDGAVESDDLAGLGAFSAMRKLQAWVARGLRGDARSGVRKLREALRDKDGELARDLALSGARAQKSRSKASAKEEEPIMELVGKRDAFSLAALKMLLNSGAADPLWSQERPGAQRVSALTRALERGNFAGAQAMLKRIKGLPELDSDQIGPVAAATRGLQFRGVEELAISVPIPGSKPTNEKEDRKREREREYSEILDELARRGADVNQRMISDFARIEGGKGSTALRWAADSEFATRELLRRGADPLAIDAKGQTALMLAASSARSALGGIGALRALLEAGADPRVLDKEGRDALGWMASGERDSPLDMFAHHRVSDFSESDGMEALALLSERGLNPSAAPRLARAVWVGKKTGRPRPRWMDALAAMEEGALLEKAMGAQGQPTRSNSRAARL